MPVLQLAYNSTRQRGSILLESLVAVAIIAIALLGIAKAMTLGMGSGADSSINSRVVTLAYSMTDRVRANQAGYRAGVYNDLSGPACTSSCTIAQQDYADWSAALAQQLPGGRGVVCLDSTPDDGTPTAPACDGAGDLVVKIWWQSKAATPIRLVLPFEP